MKKIVLAILASGMAASASQAGLVINIYQSGSDVIASTSGFIDISTLSVYSSMPTATGTGKLISGYDGFIGMGAYEAIHIYHLSGPTSSGSSSTDFTSYTGTAFGINSAYGAIFISDNYVSGTEYSSFATIAGNTLAAMGLNSGIYNYTAGGNTVTVDIGDAPAAAVPEPASWAMFIGGFGLIGATMRRRKVSVSFA